MRRLYYQAKAAVFLEYSHKRHPHLNYFPPPQTIFRFSAVTSAPLLLFLSIHFLLLGLILFVLHQGSLSTFSLTFSSLARFDFVAPYVFSLASSPTIF